MLRVSVLRQIKDSLVFNSAFLEEDFEIQQKTDSYSVQLSIYYSYIKGVYFLATIPINGNREYNVNLSPGEVGNVEVLKISGFSNLRTAISDWVHRIEQDMKIRPLERNVAEQAEQLQKLEQFIEEVPDTYFTIEEAEKLKQQLEAIKNEFSERIKKEVENSIKMERSLNQLASDINLLRVQVDALTKKNWVSAFIKRTFKWAKENPQAIRGLVETTKNLLPNEVKENVSDDLVSMFLPSGEK